MTRLSKFSLAALGGVTVFMLAGSADAATGSSKFRASLDELRRYCERLDEPFWQLKRSYGCGDKVECASAHCQYRYKRVYVRLRGDDGKERSDNPGNRGRGRGDSGRGSQSSAAK
jgi:hypothetical protein